MRRTLTWPVLLAIALLATECALAGGISYGQAWRSEKLRGWVILVSWSPSGDRLVALTTGRAKTAVIFSSSGEVLWSVDEAVAAAWSPDGSILALGLVEGTGGKVALYSATGDKLWEVDAGGTVFHVTWTPLGDKLAVVSRKYLLTLSREGEVLWKVRETFYHAAWSPDGSTLVAVGLNGIFAYDSGGGRLWRVKEKANKVTWSPDGERVVAAYGNRVMFLSKEGSLLRKVELESDAASIAWSPDGKTLAVGITKGHRVYMLSRDGETSWSSEELEAAIKSVAWSPDGSKLAVLAGGVRIFDRTGKPLWRKMLPTIATSVSWSPDGKRIAVGIAGGRVYVFEEGGAAKEKEERPTKEEAAKEEKEAAKKVPIAKLSVTAKEGFTAGAEIVFDASGSSDPDGTIVKYIWDFGDGTMLETSESTVTHSYSAPGTYTVTLTVVDNDGLKSTITAEIAVSKPPAKEEGIPLAIIVVAGIAAAIAVAAILLAKRILPSKQKS